MQFTGSPADKWNYLRPANPLWMGKLYANELEVDSRARSMTTASSPAFRGRARARRHRRDLGRGMQMTIAALGEGRGQIELVEHAGDDVINEIIDRLRKVVERRHRRHDGHTHAGELEHVLEMHLGERGLAHQ